MTLLPLPAIPPPEADPTLVAAEARLGACRETLARLAVERDEALARLDAHVAAERDLVLQGEAVPSVTPVRRAQAELADLERRVAAVAEAVAQQEAARDAARRAARAAHHEAWWAAEAEALRRLARVIGTAVETQADLLAVREAALAAGVPIAREVPWPELRRPAPGADPRLVRWLDGLVRTGVLTRAEAEPIWRPDARPVAPPDPAGEAEVAARAVPEGEGPEGDDPAPPAAAETAWDPLATAEGA